MEIITTKHTDVVQNAINALDNGGIVIIPTIRWYMICCNAKNADGLKKIFTAKNRSYNKPPLFLVPDKQFAKKLFVINEQTNNLIEHLWPGELAMYLTWSSKTNAENYCLDDKNCALVAMLPNLLGDIIYRYSRPVLSTTVNVSNINCEEDRGPAISLKEVLEFINETNIKIDLLIDGGICPAFNHTTLIDCRNDVTDTPLIVREGYVHKRVINYVLSINNGDHKDEQ